MSEFTPILINTDFTGEFKLAKNQFSETTIDDYIVSIQRRILIDLLGNDLYIKFGAYLTTPSAGKFADLKNGTTYIDPHPCYTPTDNTEDVLIDYSGILKMLKIFTFCDFTKRTMVYNTITGQTKSDSTNGQGLTPMQASGFIDGIYNEAVDLYRAAQKFIIDNDEKETISTTITDNGNNTYTALVPSTKYLVVGDIIFIDNTNYTVTAVSANTSITFSKTSGAVMANVKDIQWFAFPTYKGKSKKKQGFF
jgi:hypothetical protein